MDKKKTLTSSQVLDVSWQMSEAPLGRPKFLVGCQRSGEGPVSTKPESFSGPSACETHPTSPQSQPHFITISPSPPPELS